jgi:hypothetical protein
MSRWSDVRDRTMNRSEWNSATGTDAAISSLLERARNLKGYSMYGVSGRHTQQKPSACTPLTSNEGARAKIEARRLQCGPISQLARALGTERVRCSMSG